VPEQSDLQTPASSAAAAAAIPLSTFASEGADAPGANSGEMPAGAANAASAAFRSDKEAAAVQKKQRLKLEREAAEQCSRQHSEACKALREALDDVAARPQQAADATQALTRAILDKMLSGPEQGVRIVAPGTDLEAAHAMNVSVIALLIGRSMGLPESEMLDLGVGALLHDVGKLEMDTREARLDDAGSPAAIQAYRSHVVRGVRVAERMALSPGAITVIAQHHEHADGTGFPQQLSLDRLSLAARVVAIVNRYDNLCNPKTRALALTPHEAVATLFAQGRTRFDAAVLNTFIRLMGVYPAGSMVQLTDDRFALVVGANSSRPLKPRVLVYEPSVSRDEALLMDLEQQPDLGIRRSLPIHKVPKPALAYLDPQPRVSYYFEPLHAAEFELELAA
jgi:putative nucleotidyltransferase with HDIG domain